MPRPTDRGLSDQERSALTTMAERYLPYKLSSRQSGRGKPQLPDSVLMLMAEYNAEMLAGEDAAFAEAARRRGLSYEDGRLRRPPPKPNEISASPYRWKDPSDIPKRDWIYGQSYIRKFLTVTVAPGGVGKTSLTLIEALSLVTGRELLGKKVERKSRIWVWNLEDPHDELERRIQAACEYYDISADDIGDRFFVDSGRDHPLCTAVTTKNRTFLQKPVIDQLTAELIRREIDVLIVDPFVSSHSSPENDNSAMDMIAKAWSRVAEEANCAIGLVHHTRKLGSDAEVSAESSRGAKALTDAAREVRAINRMSADEAAKFGIDNHRSYFRMYSDKANMAPPAELSDWYQIRNVTLPNGDHVGVVAPWATPDVFADIDDTDLRKVQSAINAGEWRQDARSPMWAGIAIADALHIDADTPASKQRIKELLKAWIGNGALRTETIKDEKRRERISVVVGRWIE